MATQTNTSKLPATQSLSVSLAGKPCGVSQLSWLNGGTKFTRRRKYSSTKPTSPTKDREMEEMPQLGEIKQAKELNKVGTGKYIWHACIDCGKERWVQLLRGKAGNSRCQSCATKIQLPRCGAKNPHWKGGKLIIAGGYIRVKLQPDDFFYPTADSEGYILEHRLVVAKALGRNLHSWEIVHHRGAKYPKGSLENRSDNRYPENLQLVTGDRHTQITILENKIIHLEKQVEEQGKYITRIDRLEKLYEKLYHETELLSTYIPRLMDTLIKYWGASGRHRQAMLDELYATKMLIKSVNKDLYQHIRFKSTPKRKRSDLY